MCTLLALCVHVSFIWKWGPSTRQTHFMSRQLFFFLVFELLWGLKWKTVSSRPMQWSFYKYKKHDHQYQQQHNGISYSLLFSYFRSRFFTNNFLSGIFFFVYLSLEIFILYKTRKNNWNGFIPMYLIFDFIAKHLNFHWNKRNLIASDIQTILNIDFVIVVLIG